jgi:hypothetical protein
MLTVLTSVLDPDQLRSAQDGRNDPQKKKAVAKFIGLKVLDVLF